MSRESEGNVDIGKRTEEDRREGSIGRGETERPVREKTWKV